MIANFEIIIIQSYRHVDDEIPGPKNILFDLVDYKTNLFIYSSIFGFLFSIFI